MRQPDLISTLEPWTIRGIVQKSIVKGDGRDIMSVLLRANSSEDPNTKLSDGEVVDQIG